MWRKDSSKRPLTEAELLDEIENFHMEEISNQMAVDSEFEGNSDADDDVPLSIHFSQRTSTHTPSKSPQASTSGNLEYVEDSDDSITDPTYAVGYKKRKLSVAKFSFDESSDESDIETDDERTTDKRKQINKDNQLPVYNWSRSIKIPDKFSQAIFNEKNLLPLPAGASAALVKPTKYHYYPHNQHIYLLPECAIQQVCNAVYIRLNWTQPLCACPSRYRDPCSASLNSDDQHTTELTTDRKSKKALTLVKTCEPTAEMRICRSPRDWSLLALQNIRTGKSHYLVICRCPESSILEGPMSHDQPTYASVPGIRVYGMMCVDTIRRGRPSRSSKLFQIPDFPWKKALQFAKIANWD